MQVQREKWDSNNSRFALETCLGENGHKSRASRRAGLKYSDSADVGALSNVESVKELDVTRTKHQLCSKEVQQF